MLNAYYIFYNGIKNKQDKRGLVGTVLLVLNSVNWICLRIFFFLTVCGTLGIWTCGTLRKWILIRRSKLLETSLGQDEKDWNSVPSSSSSSSSPLLWRQDGIKEVEQWIETPKAMHQIKFPQAFCHSNEKFTKTKKKQGCKNHLKNENTIIILLLEL